MKVNNQPVVPQAALERAQGEIDSLCVKIVDLHAEIAELKLAREGDLKALTDLYEHNGELQKTISERNAQIAEHEKVTAARTQEIRYLRVQLAEKESITRLQQPKKPKR
jgi:chromosome segregation ATPase